MKSSTIRRSNLSKEKMAVLEALSKYKSQDSHDITPNVYVRPNREKELDLLWQNFKVNQKLDKSPSVYLATGFIGGVFTTAIVAGLIFISMHGINFNMKLALPAPAVKNEKLNFLPANEAQVETPADEVYTVQSGDTMESILTRFYGGYTQERAWTVMNANNMKNPNKLSIGQKLTIPMNKSNQ